MFEAENVQERTLTLTNYNVAAGKNDPKKARVTIAPSAVLFIIASDETSEIVDGVELRKTNIIVHGEGNVELYLTVLDLMTLERAIGAYFLP